MFPSNRSIIVVPPSLVRILYGRVLRSHWYYEALRLPSLNLCSLIYSLTDTHMLPLIRSTCVEVFTGSPAIFSHIANGNITGSAMDLTGS